MFNFKKFFSVTIAAMSFSQTALAAPLSSYWPPSYPPIVVPRISSDPGFRFQWNLKNTGQTGGSAGMDIRADLAWGVSTGSEQVVVAVLDSGIEPSHLDLDERLWTNAREIAGNNIDDDGNGYVDDIIGVNVVGTQSSGVAADFDGSGTHVAGILGAEAANGRGIAGVDWASKIMTVKIYNSSAGGSYADLLDGLRYAIMMRSIYLQNGQNGYGANVRVINLSSIVSIPGVNINCSSSTFGALRSLLTVANYLGISVVTVAGNSIGDALIDDNDLRPTVLTSCGATNLISTAGHNHLGTLGWFSRWGRSSIDIAAPGQDILSTYPTYLPESNPTNPWGFLSGTAMAAPHVSGVLSLMYGINPNLSPAAARNIIRQTARKVTLINPDGSTYSYWDDKVAAQGILDAGAAVLFARAKKNRTMFTDGVLSDLDARYFQASAGQTVPPFQMADLTGDGLVNYADAMIFLAFKDKYVGF